MIPDLDSGSESESNNSPTSTSISPSSLSLQSQSLTQGLSTVNETKQKLSSSNPINPPSVSTIFPSDSANQPIQNTLKRKDPPPSHNASNSTSTLAKSLPSARNVLSKMMKPHQKMNPSHQSPLPRQLHPFPTFNLFLHHHLLRHHHCNLLGHLPLLLPLNPNLNPRPYPDPLHLYPLNLNQSPSQASLTKRSRGRPPGAPNKPKLSETQPSLPKCKKLTPPVSLPQPQLLPQSSASSSSSRKFILDLKDLNIDSFLTSTPPVLLKFSTKSRHVHFFHDQDHEDRQISTQNLTNNHYNYHLNNSSNNNHHSNLSQI